MAARSPQLSEDPECWSNPRPRAQQTGALLTELAKRRLNDIKNVEFKQAYTNL